jgi:uncharacterized damage-inducible protein DinB
MYTAEALADIHERTHRSLAKLLAHCDGLGAAAVDRPVEGFGYATVRLQLHHVIGAERYWLGVLEGRMDAEDDDAAFPTIASLAAFRERVAAATRAYLAGAAAPELNTPRPMVTWGGKRRVLVPAHVILRTQTHVYQHTGQVAAMCRLLGRPVEGMEFPLG